MKTSTTWAKSLGVKIGGAAIWLLLWQWAYLAVGEDLLLVSPLSVVGRLGELVTTGGFWQTVGTSFGRIGLGFLLGVGAGTLLAVVTAASPLLYTFFSLPMGIIKATPVASFVILALVWVSGRNLSIFISFLMVLPLVWGNVHEGILQTDPQLLEMGRVYRLSRPAVARSIYLPQVLPYFLAAVKVAMGFAWKSGIAGEVLAIPAHSIGTELYNAKIYLETVDLFAWTAVVILLSLLIERAMVALVAKVVEGLAYQVAPKGGVGL